jgi:hypothetical protein
MRKDKRKEKREKKIKKREKRKREKEKREKNKKLFYIIKYLEIFFLNRILEKGIH